MVSIPRRSDKVYFLIYHQNGLCACGCGRPLIEPIDCHHAAKDSKGNRENFPLFIHSLLNLFLLRHGCHMGDIKAGKLPSFTPYQAAKYERFLERHPLIADFVNMRL